MKHRTPLSTQMESRLVLTTALIGGLGLFLLACFFSAVWVDEMCYTDPAANLAAGRGFISTVWPGQGATTFFACNTPLHPWLLGGLFWFGGFHREWVHAMNIALWVAGCFMLWRAARGFHFPESAAGRVAFFLTILFSSGGFYAAGFGRYDAVGMAVVGATAWAASAPRGSSRWVRLFGCGLLVPWAGLQLMALGLVLGFFLLLLFRGRIWRELAEWGLGVGVGLSLLWVFYAYRGGLDVFLGQAIGKRGGAGFPWAHWSVHHGGGILDPTLLVLTVIALGIALAALWRKGFSRATILAGLAVLVAIVVSQGLFALGRFPLYYSWMAVIPVAACLCAAVDQEEEKKRRGLLTGIVVLAVLWLPVWIALAWSMRERRDLDKVESVVARVVQKDDVAVVDFAAYYATFPRARRLYSADHVVIGPMSSEEKKAVTLLIVRPSRVAELRTILGGEWTRQPEELTYPGATPLPLNCWDYQVEVWRKRF